MFGGDLKLICSKEKTKVPSIVVRLVDAIEKRGRGQWNVFVAVSWRFKIICKVYFLIKLFVHILIIPLFENYTSYMFSFYGEDKWSALSGSFSCQYFYYFFNHVSVRFLKFFS